MSRVFNDPARFAEEMLEGFVSAYGSYVERVPSSSGVMVRGGPRDGKVGVILGGDGGNDPAFCGLVGHGLASGAVAGNVTAPPSAEQVHRVVSALDSGAGVVLAHGNRTGTAARFGEARDRLVAGGVDCRTVLVAELSATEQTPAEQVGGSGPRTASGAFCVVKAAGAAAERGAGIDEVERLASTANRRTRSVGVPFGLHAVPGAEGPPGGVQDGSMGTDPGTRGPDAAGARGTGATDLLAAALVDPLLAKRPDVSDGRAAVLLEGPGGVRHPELFVLWREVAARLADADVRVVEPEVGELVTGPATAAGCTLTVCWLDDELEELWMAPVDTPAYRKAPAGAWQKWTPPYDRSAVTDTPGWNGTDRAAEYASEGSREAADTVRRCLAAMLSAVAREEQALGDLDTVAGDGDHGQAMVRGLRAAVDAAADERLGAGSVLTAAGTAWGDAGVGASGTLWSAFLRALGNHVGDRNPPTPRTLADGMTEAQGAVQRLGHAHVGNKCLLDALEPFVHRLRRRLEEGDKLRPAWRSAAEVATQAANRTAELAPKVGRACLLADKSVGTPDPGAVSLALCLEAVGRALP